MNIHASELFSHLSIRYGTMTLTFDVFQKCRRPHLSWNVGTEAGNFSTIMSTVTVRCDSHLPLDFHCTWTDTVRTLVRLRSREHVPLLSYVLVRVLRPTTPRHVQPSQNPDSYWRNIAQFPFAPAHLRARVHEFTYNRTRIDRHAHACTFVPILQRSQCTCYFPSTCTLPYRNFSLLIRCESILLSLLREIYNLYFLFFFFCQK